MEVNAYNIIKRVRMTEKSGDLYRKEGKISFEVDKKANKVVVRSAVEKIWDVKVASVNIINRPGKNKMFGRRPFFSAGEKIAIVKLKDGYSIDFPGQFEGVGEHGEVK